MKTLTKSLVLAAVAATALVSCSKEIEKPEENVKASSHVEFSAQIVDAVSSTKATLTTSDDKDFAAAWVDGTDVIGLYATNLDVFDETAPATWNETKETFEADFVTPAPTVAGSWMYEAKYPYDADGNIPFGSPRVQNGNAYNSAYDIMYGTVDYSNALLGKDDTGANFVIPMNRLTGIAYFHITSSIDEDVVSATLEATGIAAENVTIASDGASVAASTGSASLDAITITFADGTAPKATDLKLWFNVLPGSYSGLKLTINTTTKNAVLNSSKTMIYTAGKLNKAVLSGLTWNINPTTLTENFSSSAASNNQYDCGSSLSTTANRADFDYTWTVSDAGTVFQNGIKLGKSGGTGAVSSSDFISSIPAGQAFTVKVYAAAWNTDGGSLIVTYNGVSDTKAPTNSPITSTSNEYSADDFANATEFSFTKVDGEDDLTIASSSKRILIDKVEVVYTDIPDTRTSVTLSFDPANPTAITLGDSFTAPSLTVDPVAAASSVTYAVSTDPANCATIDATTGDLTISAAGEITVTASIPDNDATYKPTSASYTLTVNPAPATVHGTVDNPVSLNDVAAAIDALADNGVTDDYYYVGGTVSVASTGIWSGKLTFTFGDDTHDIKAYNCLGIGGADFTSKDDIAVGDEVVVYGKLEKYVKNSTTTYEIVDCKLAKHEGAPYFTASATPLSVESTGGNCTLTINANVPWTATINNGASLKIGDAAANTSVSGSADTNVTVIIPENNSGATYTISFSTTSSKVSAPANIEIIQNAYVALVTATATFTYAANGGMNTTAGDQTGTRRNVTATISNGLLNTSANAIAVYKNATLTVSVPSGARITNIAFTGTSDNPASGFANLDGFTTNGNNGTWANDTGLQSVTFTASNKQVRLTEFTVTYKITEEALVYYTPSITATDKNIVVGENSTIGATSDSDGAITYEIVSGGSYITLVESTGAITGVAAGTAVVKVKVAKDGDYAAGEKNINVVVSEPLVLDHLTATGWPQDYTVGSAFSFGTGTVTAHYTNGSTKPLSLSDVTVTGFDSSVATTGQTVNISYEENSISKDVDVVVNIVAAGGSETLTFSSKYSSDTDVNGVTISGTNISIVFNKNTGSTAPKYYSNGTAVRWYAGNTMTISAGGKTIKSISITYTRHDNAVTSSVTTYTDITASSGTGSWSGSATSVVFTESGSSGHNRITAIEVSYL